MMGRTKEIKTFYSTIAMKPPSRDSGSLSRETVRVVSLFLLRCNIKTIQLLQEIEFSAGSAGTKG